MRIFKLIVALLVVASFSANAADDVNKKTTNAKVANSKSSQKSSSSQTSADGNSVTSLAGKKTAAPEKYKISLMAPKIENRVFPVAVHYFDDLVNRIPDRKLKATLNVPLRLTIDNSRKRRLITVFSMPAKTAIPFGKPLAAVKQIKLSSLSDVNSKKVVLDKFVGPNKKIYHTKEDAASYNIDFILKINRVHFHNGHIKVAIASTNGEDLTEICEITNSNCAMPVEFYVIPRKIKYSYSGMDFSAIKKEDPSNKFTVTQADVDFEFDINGKRVEKRVKRTAVPYSHDLSSMVKKAAPHAFSKTIRKLKFMHVDIFPHPAYMSNDRYVQGDVVVFTALFDRPDFRIRTKMKDMKLADKLEASIASEMKGTSPATKAPKAPKATKKGAKTANANKGTAAK